MRQALWWSGFLLAGIWGQFLVPGVDFLAPCLIFCQQEKPVGRALLLALPLILIQEGVGTQAFGAMFLWYGLMMLLYAAGRWVFQPRSILFIVLLGFVLGCLHVALVWISATLAVQALPPGGRLLREGLAQWLVFVGLWRVMDRGFPPAWRNNAQPA